MKDAADETGTAAVRAPIFAHPEFERLEAAEPSLGNGPVGTRGHWPSRATGADATGNPAALRISGGTLALGGNRTFNVGDSSTATSSDLVVSSVITGSGQSLTKTGAGRLGFQGANT